MSLVQWQRSAYANKGAFMLCKLMDDLCADTMKHRHDMPVAVLYQHVSGLQTLWPFTEQPTLASPSALDM